MAGHDVVTEPDAVRRSMGLTGQTATVDELLTGRENLALISALYGLDAATARRVGGDLLDRFSLSDAGDRVVNRNWTAPLASNRQTRARGRRPVLILELLPQQRDGDFGAGTDFTRALKLAKYLTSTELNTVKTVAYIPRTIKGHGVLVALACDEIAMHPGRGNRRCRHRRGRESADRPRHREQLPTNQCPP